MTTARKPARSRSKVERADVAVARAVAPYRDTLTVRVLGKLSELGDQPPLRALCVATILLGMARGDRRLRRTGLRMLAAHQLATMLKSTIKHSIDRSRPSLLVDEGHYEMQAGDSHDHDVTSFPSGHTAGALAVAQAFAREYPEHAASARLGAALIALVQIPRCAHYPSDIAVGAAVGLIAEAALQATPLRKDA